MRINYSKNSGNAASSIHIITFCLILYIWTVVLFNSVYAAQTIPGIQRLEEGITAYENGECDDAIFKLEMAVYQIGAEEKGQLWKAHFYLGLSYCLTGENDEARKQFSKAQEQIKNKLPDVLVHSPKIVRLFKGTKSKKKQEVQTSVTIPSHINLRSSYSELSLSQVQSMSNISIREKHDSGFYGHSTINHSYKKSSINSDNVVIDNATGLMWHQNGSNDYMNWKKAQKWTKKLNKRGYAGHHDWRLPSIEEASSLLESSKKNGDLYVDSVFSNKQTRIWTGDKNGSVGVWSMSFFNGAVGLGANRISEFYVRPVRSDTQ
jgi:hypothetical protein